MTEDADGARDSLVDEVSTFTEEMISHLGWELAVEAYEEDGVVRIDLAGEDGELVVQNRAEILEVFQYLLNRIFGRELSSGRLVVDCEGFRAKKEAELVEIATRVAERVRVSGEQQELGMMNPYERRIVHLALADTEGVRTESAGDGVMKRLVILPD